jgi:hypothetical protein
VVHIVGEILVSKTLYTHDKSARDVFVSLLYKAILKRDPDPEGLQGHLNRLGSAPSFEDAASLVFDFATSKEASELVALRRRSDAMTHTSFKHILSVGTHCITSNTLKRFGLKKYSGPFDWIFSNIAMVAHCIGDDFSIFLDRNLHSIVPPEERQIDGANFCDHLFYLENFGVRFVFNHFDVSKHEYYEYYVRCVDRFRSAINSSEPCLLVCISENASERDFMTLCDSIEGRGNIKLLCARTISYRGCEFGMKLAVERGPHQLYELKLKGCLGPVNFSDFADELLFYALLKSVMPAAVHRESP